MKNALHIEKKLVIYKGKKYECTGELREVKNTYPLWDAEKPYHAGDKVSYNGVDYEANWWTQSQIPDVHSGRQGSGQPWVVIDESQLDPVEPPKPSPEKRDKSNISWPKTAMVGYIDTTATGSMLKIEKEQLEHYNVIVYAFSEPDGSVSSEVKGAITQMKSRVSSDTIELLSIGGANASGFKPEQATIQNLVTAVKELSLDGIDLDIECPVDVGEFKTFCKELRGELSKRGLLLTLAPILAGEPNHPTLNIPNGGPSLESIYKEIPFDAILVQAYNSGSNFKYPLPSDPSKMVGENSPDIIQATYIALLKCNTINSKSKIVLGIPTNPGGAPSESNCWCNNNALENNAELIVNNIHAIVNDESKSEHFGGLMAWSLNTDADPASYRARKPAKNGPSGFFAEHVAAKVKEMND